MFQSDRLGVRLGEAMQEFYRARSKYRENKTKRGKIQLDAKARKIDSLFHNSIEAYKEEQRNAT